MRVCLTAPHRRPAVGQVTAECGEVAMAMVQNKCDLLSASGVGADAAEAMARRLGLRFYRTCVREGLNCDAGAPTKPSLRIGLGYRYPKPNPKRLKNLNPCMACVPVEWLACPRRQQAGKAPAVLLQRGRAVHSSFPVNMPVTRQRRKCESPEGGVSV